MTVLVTGATGDLGQRLVARLLAEGRDVRILTRRPFLAHRQQGERIPIHEWHPGIEPVPAEALAGVRTVIHLMGAPLAGSGGAEAVTLARQSRTRATACLIDGFGVRYWRLIVASVVEVSDVAGPAASDRDQAAITASLHSDEPAKLPLAMAMRAAEREAEAASEAGASVAIVRLGLVLSPGGVLARLVGLARAGFHPDLRNRLIPVIDPDDAAAMLAGLVSRPDIGGVLNGVAPAALAGADLAALLVKAGPMPFRLRAPRRLVQRRVGLLSPLLYNRTPIVPQRLIDIGAGFQHPDPKECAALAVAAILVAAPKRHALWSRAKPSGAPDAPIKSSTT